MGPLVQHTGERPLDEVTLRIYPEGASHFELYEDDGRTNAYRRGQYALTAFECVTDGAAVAVRIGAGAGDRSVVPAGRRYRLEVRMDPPATVTLEGLGTLPRHARPDEGGPGWWVDARGFVGVHLPDLPGASVTVTLRI
jgi:alpha-glucosidase